MVHPRVQRRPLSPNWICQFDWSVNRVAVVVLDWADEADNRLTRPNSICFQWMMEAIESAVASDGLFWHRSVTRCRHPASFLVILPNFSLIIARYSILKRLAGGPITGIGSSWTEFDRIRSNRIGPERRGKSEKSVQIRKWRNYRPGRSTAPEFHPTMQSSMEPLCGKLPAPLNSLTCNRMAISTHRIQSLGKQTITSIRCFLARKRRLWSALSTATRVHVRFKCPVEFHSIGVQWPRPLIDPTPLPPPLHPIPSHPTSLALTPSKFVIVPLMTSRIKRHNSRKKRNKTRSQNLFFFFMFPRENQTECIGESIKGTRCCNGVPTPAPVPQLPSNWRNETLGVGGWLGRINWLVDERTWLSWPRCFCPRCRRSATDIRPWLSTSHIRKTCWSRAMTSPFTSMMASPTLHNNQTILRVWSLALLARPTRVLSVARSMIGPNGVCQSFYWSIPWSTREIDGIVNGARSSGLYWCLKALMFRWCCVGCCSTTGRRWRRRRRFFFSRGSVAAGHSPLAAVPPLSFWFHFSTSWKSVFNSDSSYPSSPPSLSPSSRRPTS